MREWKELCWALGKQLMTLETIEVTNVIIILTGFINILDKKKQKRPQLSRDCPIDCDPIRVITTE